MQRFEDRRVEAVSQGNPNLPADSKASNGIQQSQSIDCKLYFKPGRYLVMKKAKEFITNTLAPETKLTTNPLYVFTR